MYEQVRSLPVPDGSRTMIHSISLFRSRTGNRHTLSRPQVHANRLEGPTELGLDIRDFATSGKADASKTGLLVGGKV